MGIRNSDRVSLALRRARCETVKQMLEQRWQVSSRCRSCRMQLRVDLRTIAAVRGPGFGLWNRNSRCKGLQCRGVVEFHAKAPGMAFYERLATPSEGGET
jgi:hypothetical protein